MNANTAALHFFTVTGSLGLHPERLAFVFIMNARQM